jgi:hypothetical protein
VVSFAQLAAARLENGVVDVVCRLADQHGCVPNVIFAGAVAAGIVLALTWFAMPVLVKLARPWLQPENVPIPAQNKL